MMMKHVGWLVACLLLAPALSGRAHAQASAPFNVRLAPYSATGDGVTDDTAAFVAAIAAVPATGGEIYIPAGRYILSSTLNISNKPIAFRGDGQRHSALVWTTPGIDGISYSSTTGISNTLTVKSLMLIRTAGTGGAAIKGQWPVPTVYGSNGGVTANISDVTITPPAPFDGSIYWYWGIRLGNVTGAKIEGVNVYGGTYGTGYAGISIGGTFAGDLTSGGKSIGVYIRDSDVTRWVRAIEVKDGSEDTHIDNISVRDSLWAVQFSGNAGNGNAVTNSQLRAHVGGIEVGGGNDLAITGNSIYQDIGSSFTGINITNGSHYRIIGNTIVSTSYSTANGIVLQGTLTDSLLNGNTTQGVGYGIYIAAASISNILVNGNINRNWGYAAIFNVGTSITLVNNTM